MQSTQRREEEMWRFSNESDKHFSKNQVLEDVVRAENEVVYRSRRET